MLTRTSFVRKKIPPQYESLCHTGRNLMYELSIEGKKMSKSRNTVWDTPQKDTVARRLAKRPTARAHQPKGKSDPMPLMTSECDSVPTYSTRSNRSMGTSTNKITSLDAHHRNPMLRTFQIRPVKELASSPHNTTMFSQQWPHQCHGPPKEKSWEQAVCIFLFAACKHHTAGQWGLLRQRMSASWRACW